MTDTAHSRPVLLLVGAAILLGQAGYVGELEAGLIAIALAVFAVGRMSMDILSGSTA